MKLGVVKDYDMCTIFLQNVLCAQNINITVSWGAVQCIN